MDAVLIINGVVDTVVRDSSMADLPEHPTGFWVEAPSGEVFGGFTYQDGVFTPPAPQPTPIPAQVTKRQAKLALLGAGLLDAVEAHIAALEGPEGRAAQIEWAEATMFRRDHPLVVSFGPSLGLTPEQIDNLFLAAAAL